MSEQGPDGGAKRCPDWTAHGSPESRAHATAKEGTHDACLLVWSLLADQPDHLLSRREVPWCLTSAAGQGQTSIGPRKTRTGVLSSPMTLWSKEALAAQASQWARARGWGQVSVPTLLKWKEAGLLPRPTVQSLGRGRGSTSGWPWTCYRRILTVLTLRARGLDRVRDIRLALWLDGGDIPLHLIRADLHRAAEQAIERIHGRLHTEYWDTRPDSPPSRSASRAIARSMTGPRSLEGFVAGLHLEPVADTVPRMIMTSLLSPEGQRAAVAVVHQFFAPGDGDVPASLAAFQHRLPQPVVGFLKDGPVFPGPFAGLLAHPDAFDSPILRGIDSASDGMLLNSRAAVCEAPAWWQAVFEALARALTNQPEALGPYRLLGPPIASLCTSLADRARVYLRHPQARLGGLMSILSFEPLRDDAGDGFLTFMRATTATARRAQDFRSLLP
jgi:hypothetical protein